MEVKGALYRLDSQGGKYELAKDVAAFANTGRPALIVVGLKTVKRPEGDVIVRDAPVRASTAHISALYGALRSFLLPNVSLLVRAVRDRYLMIDVPAQPPEILPVLVRRARLAGVLSEEQITVPERLGEQTAFWDGARLHSLMTAGRAALAARHPESPSG